LFKLLDKERRVLKRYERVVDAVNKLEPEISSLTNWELRRRYLELMKNYRSSGGDLDVILPEVFAIVREAAKRTIGMRHFDVQIMGGVALHEGKVAEMKTGEGKTLVATLAIALNAFDDKGVHLVTVNDYLARRDALWMGPIYLFLGLEVGVINQLNRSYEVAWRDPELFKKAMDESLSVWPVDYRGEVPRDVELNEEARKCFEVVLSDVSRKTAYKCDVTYGTNNEFGFDYLRDNLVYDIRDKVQRGHHYAIVDEVDSILIDEARTPLIISGPSRSPSNLYRQFNAYVKRFKKDVDFTVDEKRKTVVLTESGMDKLERLLGVDNLYDPANIDYLYHMLNALKAHYLFKKDVDYIVTNGEVVIVDEFTGRLLPGRRYSGGLHQAIEAKEGVKIKEESVTYATITFQNYFKLYEKLAGMTGTAKTEEQEFKQIYGMDVVVIPTHKPMIRVDHDDVIYKTMEEKYEAVVEDIVQRHKKGQPVLVGTTSIEKSELLSSMLRKKGIPHQVLNAKHHEKEAEIVARAGEKGAVTIATNMAGRGTDIKLGGGVAELGGLYVIGTERHESRRIDNQLRGRAGRQGDPGESRFYLSTEDDLVRLFGGDRIRKIMETLKFKRGEPLQHPLLTRLIEQAQKKVEGLNFAVRKHLFEMDIVLDEQRKAIYSHRDWILKGEDIDGHIKEIIEDVVDRRLEEFCEGGICDLEKLKDAFFFLPPGVINWENVTSDKKDEIRTNLLEDLVTAYERKKEELGEDFVKIAQIIMLRIIDERWRRHLDAVEHVKEAVGLRGYGQRDPVIEFKRETFVLFEEMVDSIYDDIITVLLRVVKVDSEKASKEAKRELASLSYIHNEFSPLDKKAKTVSKKKKQSVSRRFKVKR